MTNQEFFELSEKEVKSLNGSKDESSYEAWRGGYNYVIRKIRESLEHDYNDEFTSKMMELTEGDLEEIKF